MDFSFVEPLAVDHKGVFKSHSLHHSYGLHEIVRRSTEVDNSQPTLHYRLSIDDQPVTIVLEPNYLLYPQNLVIEKWFKNSTSSADEEERLHCHFTGHVKEDTQAKVAISTCNGLVSTTYVWLYYERRL